MGRHAIVSSPLRTPAVLVGVPVATVLATFGTTAVLGGVVPSAEEAPLRAEAPDQVGTAPGGAVPQGAPSAPAVSLGTPLLPAVLEAPAQAADAPESVTSTASAVRPAAGPRLVRAAPAVAAAPHALDAEDEHGDDDPTSTTASVPRRLTAPQLAPRAVTAAGPSDAVETMAQRSSGEGEGEGDRTDADDSVVDLGGPSGGLSVLTFG